MKVRWTSSSPDEHDAQRVRSDFTEFLEDDYDDKKERFEKILAQNKEAGESERVYGMSRISLPRHDAKRRLVAITRQAVRQDRRRGKFSVLSADQVWKTAGAVFYSRNWLVLRVKTPTDLLDLALDFYFAGCNVSRKLELFEQLSKKRVVLNGHGCYHPGVPEVMVPYGKTIHFYVGHGEPFLESMAMAMESYGGTGTLAIPSESREGGEYIPNYFLGFPGGLKLNVRRTTGPSAKSTVDQRLKGIPDNFVINLDADRSIPLSVLFDDSRVKRATEIHWSACRSKAPTTGVLKNGYLYHSTKGDAKLYAGHGKVTPLFPRT